MSELSNETATTVAPLRITLFGPMQVLVQGQPLPHLRSRKALWLLALLTLRHGRPVQRDWLAGILWPEVNQTQAFANLRPTLSQLRTALGSEAERLHSPNRQSLVLDLAGADVDVVAFDAAIANNSPDDLERAVDIYRSILLEGCTEEWVVQDREVRQQNCLRALQALATTAVLAGQHHRAVAFWRSAVVLDPLGEAAQRGLMEALFQTGDANAALHVYRELLSQLKRDDPRATPSRETTALYHHLREGARQKAMASATPEREEAAVPRMFGSLNHGKTELIGREDERLAVAQRLRRSRLVTLMGPGGIGKTRLAVAVAEDVLREYPDGICLVALEALPASSSGNDDQGATQQVASVLGIKERAGRSLLSDVTEHLRQKRLLLILDNCEHVIDPCAEVISHLLRQCLHVRVLSTSRETLRISDEIVWPVPALATPDPNTLPAGGSARARAMIGFDAVRLFVECAEAAYKAFALTGLNAHDVALLCARLEGVPLALELAAARVGLLTPAEILVQLNNRPLDALRSQYRDTAPRHRNLRATLEWSYGLLPSEARSFLTDLSVFRGGWTLAAAQAVCPAIDALEMLIVLRNASLINTEERPNDSADTRYSMLETVRQFAAELLEGDGRADGVRKRHALHYMSWLGTNGFNDPEFQRNFEVAVEREYANLTVALSHTLEKGDSEIFVSLCNNLGNFWQVSCRNKEGCLWLENAVRRLSRVSPEKNGVGDRGADREDGTTSHEMLLLKLQSNLLHAVGDSEAAGTVCLRIFEGYQQEGKPTEGRTWLFNASQCIQFSDLNRSLAIMDQCLPLERAASNDGRANLFILTRLATVTRRVGQAERAAILYKELMDLCRGREESDPIGFALAMNFAGQVALSETDLPKAQAHFETALAVARTVSAFIASTALCGLAGVARQSGDLTWEEALLSDAIATTGPEPGMGTTWFLRRARAESLLVRGNGIEAAELTRETLTEIRGRARASRLHIYPVLLLLAEATGADGWEPRRAAWTARLVGAANGMATRLGLLTPDRVERERLSRLHASIVPYLGPEKWADEVASGATLDDESTLQLALQSG